MSPAGDLLSDVLREPAGLTRFDLAQWDRLRRQARAADLWSRLAKTIAAGGQIEAVPAEVRPHIAAALALADKHARDIAWEARCLADELADAEVPLVLLKGAAYLAAELPAAEGRLFNDVDILVPRAALARVEAALAARGWRQAPIDAYDERYYRRWMHQIPPLRHVERHTVLDVHHTIVPPTAPVALDPAALFESLMPAAWPDAFTLEPADMVLHSAVHLFNDGEFDRALRDLSDLDRLLRRFGSDDGFWPRLGVRAARLDLRRPLFYALRQCARVLATPLPDETLNGLAAAAPPAPVLALMDGLFRRGLRPDHASADDWLSGFARWLLYVRAHGLRMPAHLLLPHLVRKALGRVHEPEPDQPPVRI